MPDVPLEALASKRKKKKKQRSGPPTIISVGAPDWMATYSDLMSLLLTFFILLFSVAEAKSHKIYEVFLSFEEYFKNDSRKLGYYPTKVTLSDISGFLDDYAKPPTQKGDDGRTRRLRRILEQIDRFASIVEEDNQQLVVIPGTILFHPDKATIRKEAYPTLLRVTDRLRRSPRGIKIVGHTSSKPLGPDADAKDHFSLGFLRALAVGRFLSGRDGDLSAMARELSTEHLDIPLDLESLNQDHFLFSSQGWNVPNPSRENLWEDPELDDRVEILFFQKAEEQ